MGKRELGLIAAFIIIGVLVWQVTAPKAEGPGFSFRGFLSNVRNEMRPWRSTAEVKTTPAIPVKASTVELRVPLMAELIIKGEERDDVAAQLTVTSNGQDDEQAKTLANESKLEVSEFADSVVLRMSFPEPGRQEARLTLRVPARLRIQLEGSGTGDVSNVSEVVLGRPRGTVKLAKITGTIRGESRISRLEVDGAKNFDVVAISGEATLRGITGDLRLNQRDGEVRIEQPGGKTVVTATEARIRINGPASAVHVETVAGQVDINDIQSAIEIEGRDSRIGLTWAKAAPAKIQHTDGRVDMKLPADAAAYNLDVRTTKGDLHASNGMQAVDEGNESVLVRKGGANAPSILVKGLRTGMSIR